ncbi:MAG: twin-arginine translocase subunit TatC [Prevotella sp.]
MTFWEHLDQLRTTIIKVVCMAVATGSIAFFFKDRLFDLLLAPRTSGFITYRMLESMCSWMGVSVPDMFEVTLINTGLAEQFVIHVKTAMCMGVLCASPYIVCELFRFVSPALYENERRYAVAIVGSGYLMFMLGVAVSYLLVFPLTFRFLGTYQVSADVANMVTLQSYMGTLIMMSLSMGLVFETPVVIWLLSRMGIVSSSFLKRYRCHAIVIILVVAAVITPTSDVFTLLVVSLPMYALYEASILICR